MIMCRDCETNVRDYASRLRRRRTIGDSWGYEFSFPAPRWTAFSSSMLRLNVLMYIRDLIAAATCARAPANRPLMRPLEFLNEPRNIVDVSALLSATR